MTSLDQELTQRLAALDQQKLLRRLRLADSPQSSRLQIDGQSYLNFSSNDYLGLANHPALKKAAVAAVEKYGAGSGASRLICGSLAPFHELEAALASFKKTEAALVFSTGYAAALGAICALLGKEDILILDKLVHACIVDAAKLSGAKIRVYAHNDLADLEDKLKWSAACAHSGSSGRTLVVTESVFSMDGDIAPLPGLVALKEKYGAWLMVDEAHATGIFGENGRGVADHFGVGSNIEIQMGTLGKALGSSGGFICGSRPLIDFLINRSRSFIFSTAPVPAAAAAAAAAIQLMQSSEGDQLRQSLQTRIAELKAAIGGPAPSLSPAILPIVIGDETKALEAAAKLREQNIFVPAIRYPTVARGKARLRVTVTAAHSPADISTLIRALQTLRL